MRGGHPGQGWGVAAPLCAQWGGAAPLCVKIINLH